MKLASPKTLALSVLFSASLVAQLSTLTQSTNGTTITAGNSIACTTGTVGSATWTSQDNGYFRSYSLAGLPGSIDVVSIRFGVEAVTTTAPAGFPMIIRLYNDPTGGVPTPYSSLVLRHTENFFLPASGASSIATIAMTGPTATFLTSETLVVEVNSPLGPTGTRFFMGSNALGQSAACYLRAVACGAPDPTNCATLQPAPTMYIIIDVNYAPAGQGNPYPGTSEDLTMLTGVNANPLTTGVGSFVKSVVAPNTVQVKVVSTNNTFNYREFALIAQGFLTGNPPFPPAAPNIWLSFPALTFLIGGPSSLIGPMLLPPGGITVAFTVPPGLGGMSVIFQGAIVTFNAPFASNGLYASTNGHVFQM